MALDPYWSHVPVLCACLAKLGGNLRVLELGCGQGSTPLLSAYIETQGRELVCVESDPAYLDKIAKSVPCDPTMRRFVQDPTGLPTALCQEDWDLVLVDQRPERARVPAVGLLANTHTKLIVVHDSNACSAAVDSNLFKFRWRYTREHLTTDVLSNVMPLGWLWPFNEIKSIGPARGESP